jgi:hypothetical protein
MKVYNETKTQELKEYDPKKGYLKRDTITHYFEEVKEVKEQGHYVTIAEYPNGGKDVEWVVDVEGVEYQPSREEVEDVYVYVPYTEKELLENKKLLLREKREPLLTAFDKYKSNVNYGVEFESDEQREKIIAWYRLLLELNEYAFNNVPDRVKYYL